MNQNTIYLKSYSFAIRIVNIYKEISENKREYILSKQLLKSGTAVGALVHEAQQAESKADFIHKMSIALKEANETEYWLRLLKDTNFVSLKTFEHIFSKNKE